MKSQSRGLGGSRSKTLSALPRQISTEKHHCRLIFKRTLRCLFLDSKEIAYQQACGPGARTAAWPLGRQVRPGLARMGRSADRPARPPAGARRPVGWPPIDGRSAGQSVITDSSAGVRRARPAARPLGRAPSLSDCQ